MPHKSSGTPDTLKKKKAMGSPLAKALDGQVDKDYMHDDDDDRQDAVRLSPKL